MPNRSDLCFATTNRQAALKAIAGRADVVVVIGSVNSSNTRALEKVARASGCPRVLRVNAADELPDDLSGTVGVTAGASAPDELVDAVLARLAPVDGIEEIARHRRGRVLPPAARAARPAAAPSAAALALGLGAPAAGSAPGARPDLVDVLGTPARDRHVSAADVLARLAGEPRRRPPVPGPALRSPRRPLGASPSPCSARPSPPSTPPWSASPCPAIGRNFHLSVSSLQWVVSAYLLALAGLLLVGGALGDRYGRRRIFVIGVVVLRRSPPSSAPSAPDPAVLIAGRALQGVGAALLTPGSLAILRASFAPDDQGRAIGAWSGLGGVATAIGPFLGGFLISAVSWRLIFLINLPLAVVVVVMAARHVPETTDPDGRRAASTSPAPSSSPPASSGSRRASSTPPARAGGRRRCVGALVGGALPWPPSCVVEGRTRPPHAAPRHLPVRASSRATNARDLPRLRRPRRGPVPPAHRSSSRWPTTPPSRRGRRCCPSPPSCWSSPPAPGPWPPASAPACRWPSGPWSSGPAWCCSAWSVRPAIT